MAMKNFAAYTYCKIILNFFSYYIEISNLSVSKVLIPILGKSIDFFLNILYNNYVNRKGENIMPELSRFFGIIIKLIHTLIVIETGNSVGNTLISAHANDAFGKSVYEYGYEEFRCIHIL